MEMPHIHKDYDFVVCVYIVFCGKVLLIKHKELGLWLPIGGHIELNETPDEALVREVKEECGLDIEVIGGKHAEISGITLMYTPAFVDVHAINKEHKHIGLVYFARAKTGNAALAEQEHDAIQWVGLDELENYNLRPNVLFYAKEALRRANDGGKG